MARVLVIGTDDAARLLLTNILEGGGYMVSVAGSFAEGREMLSRSPVDAVLTDLQWRGSDALQSIACLRMEFPLVKILAIAREQQTIDFLAVRVMGADDILRQPLTIDALLDAVEQALRERDSS